TPKRRAQSAAVCAAPSPSTSHAATGRPHSARASHVARPMPEAAPVTRTGVPPPASMSTPRIRRDLLTHGLDDSLPVTHEPVPHSGQFVAVAERPYDQPLHAHLRQPADLVPVLGGVHRQLYSGRVAAGLIRFLLKLLEQSWQLMRLRHGPKAISE